MDLVSLILQPVLLTIISHLKKKSFYLHISYFFLTEKLIKICIHWIVERIKKKHQKKIYIYKALYTLDIITFIFIINTMNMLSLILLTIKYHFSNKKNYDYKNILLNN